MSRLGNVDPPYFRWGPTSTLFLSTDNHHGRAYQTPSEDRMLQVPFLSSFSNSSAFWGDSVHAARQLIESPDAKLDFLVGDYLAGLSFLPILQSKSDQSPK
jgi:hypothetical protein